ncbi:MAG: hypothetical protein KF870_06545 [Leadbetterella sp.]|nr:hypothetical protein [Leadbetterella sp.]
MKACVLYIVLVLTGLQLPAQVITLSDEHQKYPAAYPWYREDRSGSLSFEEVIQSPAAFTRSSTSVPDFMGNLSRAIWYRFEVVNNSPVDQWFLEIKGGYMHRITLYQLNPGGAVDSMTLSADEDFKLRPIRSHNLVYPVQIPVGQQRTFYVKATSKSLIRASMSFNTMQTLYENSTFTSYGNGFFAAFSVALLLYNLFVYFSLRERVYLYYIGYIFTTLLHTNLVSGHVVAIFPWLDFLNTTVLLSLVSVFSILFTNSFLQTRRYVPFIYKSRWYVMAAFILPVLLFFSGQYALAILVLSNLMFLLFAYWMLTGIIAWRNGFQPAIYYISGFGALALMNMIFELKILGLVNENYWIDSCLYIGSALEAMILSFALASKINFYKKEKERLQEETYHQAIHFSRELISMQEAERKRIASELHDGLGQKLILIKNKILRAEQPGASTHLSGEALSQNVADAIQEVRDISYALRPYQLDLLGLTSSVKSLVQESLDAVQMDYRIDTDNIDGMFSNDAQINIYRIIQECINNIVKHSGAANVEVVIKKQKDGLKICIADDGKGFDRSVNPNGFGLKGIKERLQILGGTLTLTSAPSGGTRFEFQVPE